ncbi:recombinase family protein [Ancylothrix sp. C2]|uniref:recombinase family protein n=1 Tax=Ancylothrix sp. D3o TaxID=2953691 RepID=UPI0021BACB36|nr:recombinase family protein [Ancylothrix sp. D3o]MCT7948712.1 recombinase family protein [Ancylothrix sp. D3o]
MRTDSIWITGPTQSGKTSRLVEQFCVWMQGKTAYEAARLSQEGKKVKLSPLPKTPGILVFAANGWVELADKIASQSGGKYPSQTTTPLRFFRDEVILFWPLLISKLNLRAQFPMRLRPETEQELATKLWRSELDSGLLRQENLNESRLVRRLLDLMQLASASGTPIEEIAIILAQGISEQSGFTSPNPACFECMGESLLRWRGWCLERGLLTYGIICELYWRYLLTDAIYQQHLTRRYEAVLADDVDEYPAITRNLFEFLLDKGAPGLFTFNRDGAVRLGLDADPDYMAGLAGRCVVERLNPPVDNVGFLLGETIIERVLNVYNYPSGLIADPALQSIQEVARSQLLRKTADVIIKAIKSKEVEAKDIAVITPGLDAIARYSLMEILSKNGIPVEPLNEQRPLASSPMIRGLLTLLGLVYPGLGRLVERDAVAEMLVILSRQSVDKTLDILPEETSESMPFEANLVMAIDPVRAGLLVDHCFHPDPEFPRLLPVTEFPRWDRLGYRAKTAYEEILRWIDKQRNQLQQRLIPSFVSVLDRAIQEFLWKGKILQIEQVTALRELIEIAQHYWQVDERLRQIQPQEYVAEEVTVGEFILLLRRSSISANPYRGLEFWPPGGAVTLGTIFQYRFNRRFHRWQFWLDAGSPLWQSSGEAARFGYGLFQKSWNGRSWMSEDQSREDEARLRRILLDLLCRARERVYLCHSDLAVNGQDQTGPLLTLVNATVPVNSP